MTRQKTHSFRKRIGCFPVRIKYRLSADTPFPEKVFHVVIHILFQGFIQRKCPVGNTGGDHKIFRFIEDVEVDSLDVLFTERAAALFDQESNRCLWQCQYNFTSERETFSLDYRKSKRAHLFPETVFPIWPLVVGVEECIIKSMW